MIRLSLAIIIGVFWGIDYLMGQNCFAPTQVNIPTITATTANITWDAMQYAQAYEVNYKPMNAPATMPWTTLTANTNSITLTGLVPSTLYSTQIRTICSLELSNYTTVVNFSTASCVPPAGLTSNGASPTTVSMVWNTVNGASGYNIHWRMAQPGRNVSPWSNASTASNSYTITGLTANTLYETRLVTNCGSGVFSDTSTITYVSTGDCGVPMGLTMSNMTATSLSLQWTNNPNATQYNIDYREVGTVVWSSVNSNTNSRQINGLTSNTKYEIRVRSRCAGNVFTGYTLPIIGYTLPCGMPQNGVVSNVGLHRATISWNNGNSATHYELEYRKISDANWTSVPSNTATKTINNLQSNTSYQARIRSKCGPNTNSAYSDTLVFKTLECEVPQNLGIYELTVHGARLGWSPAGNAARYELHYRAVDDANWTILNASDTTRLLNNLSQSNIYIAKVRSVCPNNLVSDFSDSMYIAVDPCVAPSGFQTTAVSYTEVSLAWDTITDANRYTVEYKPVSDTLWSERRFNSPSGTIGNLAQNTQYHARITSDCGNNTKSETGDTVVFTTQTCGIPTNMLVDSVGYDKLFLSWDADTNLTYRIEYRLEGDTAWQVSNANRGNKTLSGLVNGGYYHIKIKSKCGNNIFSEYSNIIQVVLKQCYGAYAPEIDTLSPTRLRLKWTYIEDTPRHFTVRFKKKNDVTWSTRNVNDTNTVFNNIVLADSMMFEIIQKCSNQTSSDPTSMPGNVHPCHALTITNCDFLTIRDKSWKGTGSRTVVITINDANNNVVSTNTLNLNYSNGRITDPINLDFLTNGNANSPFTITVTIDGCSRRIVYMPSNLTASMPSTYVACMRTNSIGASVSVSVSGGTQPYLYSWSGGSGGGQTNLISQAGEYSVTVIDANGCTATARTTVVINAIPNISVLGCGQSLCREELDENNTYDIPVSWDTPLSITQNIVNFTITPAIAFTVMNIDERNATIRVNPIASGTYTYTITVGIPPCTSSVTCSLTIRPAIHTTFDPPPCYYPNDVINIPVTVTPDAGAHIDYYHWSLLDNAGNIVSNAQSQRVTSIPIMFNVGVPIPSNGGAINYRLYIGYTHGENVCLQIHNINIPPCTDTLPFTRDTLRCFPERLRVCAPVDGSTYVWRINGVVVPDITQCIWINDVTGGTASCTVDGVAYNMNLGNNIYPRGQYTVLVDNAARLLANLGVTNSYIDPLFNNRAGFPAGIQGTFVIPANRNFIIDVNITFRNIRFIMEANSSITVNRGANLFMENCYLRSTNPATTNWNGILVGTQSDNKRAGRLIFNNVTLEHATTGVQVTNGLAGLVWIDNSCLNENKTHISMIKVPASWQARPFPPINAPIQSVHTTNINTPLVLRNTIMTSIDLLPNPQNITDRTDLAIRIASFANNLSAMVGTNVRPNFPACLYNSPLGLAFYPPANTFGWLARNRITRCDVGIRTTNSRLHINNNEIGNLVDLSPVNQVSTGIDLNFTNASGFRTVVVGTDFTDMTRFNARSYPAAVPQIPSNIIAQNPQWDLGYPPIATRTDYGIHQRRGSGHLFAQHNLFQNINATTGARSTGIFNENPVGAMSFINNNVFDSVTYGYLGLESLINIAPSSSNINIHWVTNNQFRTYQNGVVIFNHPFAGGLFGGRYDPATPNTMNNANTRGAVNVSNNLFDTYRVHRNDMPIGIPIAFDAGIVVGGEMTQAWPFCLTPNDPNCSATDAQIDDQLLRHPPMEINSNHFIGQGRFAIHMAGENGLSSSRIQINNNVVNPRNNGIDNPRYRTAFFEIGIDWSFSTNVDVKNNLIDLGQFGGQGTNSSALFCSQSKLSNVFCNRVQGAGTNSPGQGLNGLVFMGDCIPRVNIKYNLMRNCITGLYLTNANSIQGCVGIQGDPATCNFNAWDDRSNPNNNMIVSDSPIGSLTQIFTSLSRDFPNMTYDPSPSNRGGFPVTLTAINPVPSWRYTNNGVTTCSQPDSMHYFNYSLLSKTPIKEIPTLLTEEGMARGLYDNGDPDMQYLHRQTLLTLLSEPGNQFREHSSILDSFYNAMSSSVVGGQILVERMLRVNPTKARALNTQLTPTCLQEKLQQEYYNLYLDYQANQKLTIAELSKLGEIAEQCYKIGGKAVMQARFLKYMIDQKKFYKDYTDDCQKDKKIVVNKAVESGTLNLYPNPAGQSFDIDFDLPQSASQIQVYNTLGMPISNVVVNSQRGKVHISSAHWAAGVYICKVVNADGQVIKSGKLIIIK